MVIDDVNDNTLVNRLHDYDIGLCDINRMAIDDACKISRCARWFGLNVMTHVHMNCSCFGLGFIRFEW